MQDDQPAFPKGRVLLVDDNARYRTMLTRYMKSLGFHCTQANDGTEALWLLADQPGCELVMCDVAMPRMNGLTLLTLIHERWPRIAVIMITGVADLGLATECLALGAMDFVLKPFELEELRGRVSRVLQRQRMSMEGAQNAV